MNFHERTLHIENIRYKRDGEIVEVMKWDLKEDGVVNKEKYIKQSQVQY